MEDGGKVRFPEISSQGLLPLTPPPHEPHLCGLKDMPSQQGREWLVAWPAQSPRQYGHQQEPYAKAGKE